MQSTIYVAALLVLCSFASTEQIPAEPLEDAQPKTNRRMDTGGATFPQQGAINAVYQPEGAPVYQPQLGLAVSSYQPQSGGGSALPNHPKESLIEKKPIAPFIKDTKPVYYPKESSYSTIPEQPSDTTNSARFVADPTRNQIIEEISPSEIHQLTMRQPHYPYTLVPQPLTMPGYNFNYIAAVPGAASPYVANYQPQAETATVKYSQTEHGFMDRVWGEVMTVREAITTDFFGNIPVILQNIWDAIVGAVTSTSARMFSSFDWLEAFQLIVRQLN